MVITHRTDWEGFKVYYARRGHAAATGEGDGYAGWRGLQQLDFPRRDALGIGYFFIKEKVSSDQKNKDSQKNIALNPTQSG